MIGITRPRKAYAGLQACREASRQRRVMARHDPDGSDFLVDGRSNTIISGGKNRGER
jgi:hypothetical protein